MATATTGTQASSGNGRYRVEYAPTGRAKCHGPCGAKIAAGQLRVGTRNGLNSFCWRHGGCLTSQVIQNMKRSLLSPQRLDSWGTLAQEDKATLTRTFLDGKVSGAEPTLKRDRSSATQFHSTGGGGSADIGNATWLHPNISSDCATELDHRITAPINQSVMNYDLLSSADLRDRS